MKSSIKLILCLTAMLLVFKLQGFANSGGESLENAPKQKVVIGIRAYSGADAVIEEWSETINHLNKTIPNHEFKILPLVDYEEIENKVKSRDMDFYIGDPASYIELEALYGITRLATLQRKKDGFYFDKFGAVIFTSSKNKHINSFADFKDKTFVGVSQSSFAGYRMAYREMINNDIKPEKVFKNILFSGGRGDEVVTEVLSHENYIGSVRTGLLESMIKNGSIARDDIKVINSIKYDFFPFMVSTKLYPEFPFARLSHVSEDLGKKVLISLLSIQEDSRAATTGKYARWLIPNDYSDVTNLMKELNVGIFKNFNKVTLEKVIKEYWYLISTVFVFIVILVGFSIRLKMQGMVIREHKDKLKKILDVQDSIVILYDGKEVLDCNLKFLKFFDVSNIKDFTNKYKSLEVVFEKDESFVDAEYYGQLWYEYIATVPYEIHKIKLRNSKGEEHIFKINVSIYDVKHFLYVVTFNDITTLEHLQEQNKQNEKLLYEQKKLASMGEMIGNIAHQWRQPLSVISTSATGLKMQLELGLDLSNEELIKYCDDMNSQAQYLSKTIDDFRNFIKNDKNKREFKVSDMLNETISLVSASLISQRINIEQNLRCDCLVLGYKNELTQAIMNIINNSKDAIVNHVTQNEIKCICIETREFNNQVEIYIKDNGGGIPDDIKDKIFEPYFTTKHQSQGTGIGLYMTRQIIVEHNNGKIKAENIEFEYEGQIYKGAMIVISLPCIYNKG